MKQIIKKMMFLLILAYIIPDYAKPMEFIRNLFLGKRTREDHITNKDQRAQKKRKIDKKTVIIISDSDDKDEYDDEKNYITDSITINKRKIKIVQIPTIRQKRGSNTCGYHQGIRNATIASYCLQNNLTLEYIAQVLPANKHKFETQCLPVLIRTCNNKPRDISCEDIQTTLQTETIIHRLLENQLTNQIENFENNISEKDIRNSIDIIPERELENIISGRSTLASSRTIPNLLDNIQKFKRKKNGFRIAVITPKNFQHYYMCIIHKKNGWISEVWFTDSLNNNPENLDPNLNFEKTMIKRMLKNIYLASNIPKTTNLERRDFKATCERKINILDKKIMKQEKIEDLEKRFNCLKQKIGRKRAGISDNMRHIQESRDLQDYIDSYFVFD